jgi:Cu2+-exporting ATPase
MEHVAVQPLARVAPPRRLPAPPLEVKKTSHACEHCGSAVVGDARFCCEGCRAVRDLLLGEGLTRYYELRNGAAAPVADDRSSREDAAWLELAARRLALGGPGLQKLELDVQGISCSACIWLIDELFRRTHAAGRALVNPARGTIDLWVESGFDLPGFVHDLARFGYRVGPRRASSDAPPSDLVGRVGICAAIAMNTMLFAIARYAGLADPGTLRLFQLLELGLATAAFLVGGTVFVASAARALRRGVLHLDLPIAIGIVLGYLGSIASLVVSEGHDSYLDTLVVFTTLMLVGRLLRQRVVARNRAQILDDAGAEAMLVRKVETHADGTEVVAIVPATSVRRGDVLLVTPGDVVPVAAELVDDHATLSLEWITGEADPIGVARGDDVVAGSSVAAGSAARFRAREDLAASALLDLLRAPAEGRDAPGDFERRIATFWVPFVLIAAGAGFGVWWWLTGDATRALAVAVGLLVVTCPCAFGIATPLGHELVLAELRRRGLLVRSAGFLERAADVTTIVFDKTGTLTTGRLRIEDASPLEALSEAQLLILHQLAVRSSHPKSAAVADVVPERCRTLDPNVLVHEIAGSGVETVVNGVVYRLGSRTFALAPARSMSAGDVVFSADGAPLASLVTSEVLRHDARKELDALRDERFETWMLTGDGEQRAETLARFAGIPSSNVVAGRSPAEKAAFLRERDHGDVLFLGDGINDAPAAAIATCSGTPAAGRTFLAARTDFYLLGEGLAGVRLALRGARALRRRTRGNLRLAALYNAIALGLCFGGLMSPIAAAVLMPVSSILAVTLTVRDLSRKDAPWKS